MRIFLVKEDLARRKALTLDPGKIVRSAYLGSRRRVTGTIRDGDWDRRAVSLTSNIKIQSCIAHWRDGVSWEDTGVFAYLLGLIQTRGRPVDGCLTLEDLKARYDRLDALFETVKARGKLDSAHERLTCSRAIEPDGVMVHVGRNGEAIFGTAGHHRLAMSQVLGLKRIPAMLGAVHPEAIEDVKRTGVAPSRASAGYQKRRGNTSSKFEMLAGALDFGKVSNILDVGCNQGLLAQQFAERGKFAVGVDIAPYFADNLVEGGPVFGILPMTEERAASLPLFDAIFLMSVHHQWHLLFGDEQTRRMIKALADKAQTYFVIEIAAIASKYGFGSNAPFNDNDEKSVVSYGLEWLRSLGATGTVRYIGRNPEHPRKEPYRYSFVIDKTA